jgi:cell division protein FtsL
MNDLKRKGSRIRKAMAQGQGRLVLAGALVALLFAAVGVFHTAARVEGVRAAYELGKVEAEYRELLRVNKDLKLELASRRSAPRLENIARERLGLSPPSAAQIVSMVGRKTAVASANAEPAGSAQAKAVAQLSRERATRNP